MRDAVAPTEGHERDLGMLWFATTAKADVENEVFGARGSLLALTTVEQNQNTEILQLSDALRSASPTPSKAASAADVNGTSSTEYLPLEVESAGREHRDRRDAELPAFADAENVAIHDEIKEKQRILCQNEAQTGQKAERVTLMRQHLQQLREEAAQLEALSSAKASHINSDRHMQGVAVRQVDKLKKETRQQQEQQQALQNRLTGLQLDIARGQEQIDCFKLRMKWSEEELAQWRSAALQKEEDLKIVGEFKRRDDARAAELMTQTQRASFEVAEARRRLREEETAARAARAELQRSIEQFSEQQKDRALLIAQGRSGGWIAASIASPKLSKKCSKRCADNWKNLVRLARPSAQGFAKREEVQNKALRGEVTSAEQHLDTSRELVLGANAAVSQLAEQVAGLRGQLSAAASRSNTAKKQLAKLHENLADHQQRLDGLRKKKELAEKRLAREKKNVRSAGEAAEASETFHTQAAARLQQLQQQVKTQLQQQEAERSRQQELLYSIDFQCQAMQRRLTLASGYKTAAEAKSLQKNIKELQAVRLGCHLEDDHRQWCHFDYCPSLRSSFDVCRSQHLSKRNSQPFWRKKAQRSLNQIDAEESRCATSVEEIRLACISLDKELHAALQEKEELVLAESLRKLEEVLGAVDSELDAAKGQLTSLPIDGHGRSQAYYVIKAGQEREELQRLGAALQRRLQAASAEVEGLEATVRDVRACNARLRSRLQSETGALTALRGEKEHKENALFLKKHLTFTHYQQIEALKKATELQQKNLEEAKTTHLEVLNDLEAAEGERKRLQSQSCVLEAKLARTLQQLEKAHASIQERRSSRSTGIQDRRQNNFEFCNAEMRCHAESLRVLLQSLYSAIG
ncbi:hypothetical protein Emag_007368 [Eimeria magna]